VSQSTAFSSSLPPPICAPRRRLVSGGPARAAGARCSRAQGSLTFWPLGSRMTLPICGFRSAVARSEEFDTTASPPPPAAPAQSLVAGAGVSRAACGELRPGDTQFAGAPIQQRPPVEARRRRGTLRVSWPHASAQSEGRQQQAQQHIRHQPRGARSVMLHPDQQGTAACPPPAQPARLCHARLCPDLAASARVRAARMRQPRPTATQNPPLAAVRARPV